MTTLRKGGQTVLAGLRQGAGETRGRASSGAPGLAAGLLALLAALFAIFFDLLGVVLNVAIAIWEVVAGPLRAGAAALVRLVAFASRALTPARALTLVLAGALVLLALSQFADYRSIAIGTDNYTDGVQTVAPAPERDREVLGGAHSYAFVPLAGVCLLLLPLAIRGRWQLCRLIAVVGIAAIVVGLLIDRPSGLDLGKAPLAYSDVQATLLGGFYAQLFAGLVVAFAATLLGAELRSGAGAKPGRRSRAASSRRRPRTDASPQGARA